MARPRIGPICVVWVLYMLCGIPARAGHFALHVNDVSGLDEPWPLVGGLPFPEGELRDASRIRIVDAHGREVPAQVDVAATWRDGSIRWALAGLTASPQGDYRVEYGPGVTRSAPENPLVVVESADGRLTVDTGAAVYEFEPDKLLPESARMGDTVFLADAGDGAYLVDNQGRLSRVAGARAEVETEIVKRGPMRAVVRREGWYVTGDGERVARARMWFYLSVGSPYMRVTHSLVFTEDTNELWVRDYGLGFRTPEEPQQVVFAHREAEVPERQAAMGGVTLERHELRDEFSEMFSGNRGRDWDSFTSRPEGKELYMIQDVYPHLLEREFRAVIGRASPSKKAPVGGLKTGADNLWLEDWEQKMEVAGDWGDGRYQDYALTVVMPQLAQRFPKEIAFGPGAARVAFWSGRSARELDFRALTLVHEYWQKWATDNYMGEPRAPGGPMALASHPSNAQGAARTHDLWLLPRSAPEIENEVLTTHARAASHPPLLYADPVWLSETGAVGWPVHHRDKERFPKAEEITDKYWEAMMRSYVQLRHTGFIEWGKNHGLRHALSHFFRISRLTDYGLGRYVWSHWGRSGERSFWEYGSRLNRFVGDWELANWTAGDKFKGAFASGDNMVPFHWGDGSYPGLIRCEYDITGQTILPWLLEYYMTGDEHALELVRMVEDAYRTRWAFHRKPHSTSDLHLLALLYSLDWDETFADMARQRAEQCIDLDNPTGIDDQKRYGSLYKLGTDLLPVYEYYRITGDETAREAVLQGVDYMYRLGDRPHSSAHLTRGGGQNYVGILFAIAYQWTGNVNYLRVLNDQISHWEKQEGIRGSVHGSPMLLNVPAALHFLAEAEAPLDSFPVLSYSADDEVLPILFEKEAGRAVHMNFYLRLEEGEDEDAAPEVVVESGGSEIDVETEVERAFRTRNPGRRDMRGRHVSLNVPARAPEGGYTLRLPNAQRVVVLDSDAAGTRRADEDLSPRSTK